jgi:flagellar protein FlbD
VPVSDFTRKECSVIRLTRLNGQELEVNSDLIKFIEKAPDTVLTLTSGEKIIVRENCEQVVERVIAFRRKVLAGMLSLAQDPNTAAALTRADVVNHNDSPTGGTRRG